MMKSKDFISMLQKALNSNTVYALGMWGQVINDSIITSKTRQYPSFYTSARVAQLNSLKGKNYFGFDCVCLVKSVLWGWEGNPAKSNGGAKYASNGVPDIGADTIITKCKNVSTDFSKIVPGALVWMKGHVGVYIGNGQCIECTTNWTSKVLQSTLKNNGVKGQFERTWTKWGLLPYVDYSDQTATPSKPVTPAPAPTPKPITPTPAPTTSFKNGDKVKLNKGAKNTKGVSLASFVYDRVHDLTNVTSTEGVIKYNGVVVARVFLKDLTLVSSAANGSTKPATPAPAPAVKQVTEGCKVRLNKGAKTTKGVSLASFVYNRDHIATNVANGECVIRYNGVVVARVYTKDCTVV